MFRYNGASLILLSKLTEDGVYNGNNKAIENCPPDVVNLEARNKSIGEQDE